MSVGDGEMTRDRSTTEELNPDGTIGYEQWGIDFFAEAINEDRVLDAVRIIAGQQIEFGPVDAGPGGIATVKAYGEIKQPSASLIPGEHVAYRVLLPIELTFEVVVQVEQRFEAELLVPLTLKAVPRSGVRIFIEADPPRIEEMQVDLHAQGMRSAVLQRVADVEGELRRFVAEYVIELLEKPHVLDTRTIDVCGVMDGVWAVIGPKPEDGRPGRHGLG
jgi:hypothetical protein